MPTHPPLTLEGGPCPTSLSDMLWLPFGLRKSSPKPHVSLRSTWGTVHGNDQGHRCAAPQFSFEDPGGVGLTLACGSAEHPPCSLSNSRQREVRPGPFRGAPETAYLAQGNLCWWHVAPRG